MLPPGQKKMIYRWNPCPHVCMRTHVQHREQARAPVRALPSRSSYTAAPTPCDNFLSNYHLRQRKETWGPVNSRLLATSTKQMGGLSIFNKQEQGQPQTASNSHLSAARGHGSARSASLKSVSPEPLVFLAPSMLGHFVLAILPLHVDAFIACCQPCSF